MTGACPHAVSVPGIVSMKGCKLTETKSKWDKENINKSHFQLCPPIVYEGDYTKCLYYQNWKVLNK